MERILNFAVIGTLFTAAILAVGVEAAVKLTTQSASAMTMMPGNQTGGKMTSGNATGGMMNGNITSGNMTSGMMKGNTTSELPTPVGPPGP
ncbi:MAG: hypothetical protein M3Y53_01565 [Thermoproteota archaeon]|nr:hypothetical protein [Thermoproteota archaeon]